MPESRSNVNKFATIHDLEAWLEKHQVSYEEWGKNKSKSLENLWQELEAGEVQLKDSPPLRVVDVVQVIIRRGLLVLVEAEQEFFNGQRRFRNQPPSEKIKPGEAIQDTARRCLHEELGLVPERVTLQMESYLQHQTNTNSISYPGLPSQYNFHLIEAAVSDLPTEDFWRENLAGDDSIDPVKRHRWSWQPASSIEFITNQ